MSKYPRTEVDLIHDSVNHCYVLVARNNEEFGRYDYTYDPNNIECSLGAFMKADAQKTMLNTAIYIENREKEQKNAASMDFLDRCMGILP